MAGIKYSLQKQVFDNCDEKIISLAVVVDQKNKKNSYLCITTSAEPPGTPSSSKVIKICQVKQYDKGVYKKKRTWNLEDLKTVDGKNENSENHEFNLHLEKEYRWFASNLHERQNFLSVLWKLVNKHVINKADFRNIPKVWLEISSPEKSKEPVEDENSDEIDAIEYEDFNALTDREEGELNKWIKEYNYAISNAELFIEQLGKNLSDLDGANVQRFVSISFYKSITKSTHFFLSFQCFGFRATSS
jgi:hypothetical protein